MNTLRQHRNLWKVSQVELGRILHISRAHISAIETLNISPSPRNAKKMSDFFGVKVEVLFPGGLEPRKFGTHVEYYLPPVPAPAHRTVALQCWKCGAPRVTHGETCYQCGAEFWVEEEARA